MVIKRLKEGRAINGLWKAWLTYHFLVNLSLAHCHPIND